MQMDILAMLATIVFVLIAVILIPVLLQIRHTVQRVDEFLALAQREVLPLLRELRELSENLKTISVETERDLVKVRPLFDSLEQTGEMVHNITSVMNSGVGRVIGSSLGTWMGVRAARKAFVKEIKEPKRR
ncbi:MAG: DUF948 domain-containing protein [Desulfuromonadales bacterium]|nr:DUF948 domain-containing protein [Desulfuromonadales bacterium]